ncbi:2179_t:CDS:2 [Funneliformis caledonium]|uniref:2179_t:CDS:1 n=1 Tax=Funneliformis caledonium TaxID=1117310 RepID=A0A9N9DAR5_9GLOM|nr:2179_t:CDS:2 [Funneliformis caledonium]
METTSRYPRFHKYITRVYLVIICLLAISLPISYLIRKQPTVRDIIGIIIDSNTNHHPTFAIYRLGGLSDRLRRFGSSQSSYSTSTANDDEINYDLEEALRPPPPNYNIALGGAGLPPPYPNDFIEGNTQNSESNNTSPPQMSERFVPPRRPVPSIPSSSSLRRPVHLIPSLPPSSSQSTSQDGSSPIIVDSPLRRSIPQSSRRTVPSIPTSSSSTTTITSLDNKPQQPRRPVPLTPTSSSSSLYKIYSAKSSGGSGAFIYVNAEGNKSCSNLCIAIFSLIATGVAVAVSACCYLCHKKFVKKEKLLPSSVTNDTLDLEGQPTLPSYDSQPPAYSELRHSNSSSQLPHSEAFKDAEGFFKNNQPSNSLPPDNVIQELLKQDTYSSWKFLPEKILEQLEIILSNEDGRELTFNNSKKKGLKYNEIIVQSNLPFFNPKKCIDNEKREVEKNEEDYELHYFEISIIEKSDDVTKVAIGLTTKPYPYYRMPGYNKYSIGYHSDSGHKYQDSQYDSQEYGPKWGESGDTIGCGYKPSSGEVFFTKDGEYLGKAHSYNDEKLVWYPTVGVEGTCKLEVNFGDSHSMFKYKPARSFGPGAQGGWLYKHLSPKKWSEV